MHQFVLLISTILARIAGFAILASTVMIAAEVLARKLFTVSLVGADEISGYVLAISITWGASLAIVRRAHVRIDLLHNRLPSLWAGVLDILALLAMLGFTGLLGWFATRLLMTNIKVGAVSNTGMEVPLWIPQSLWVGGIWVFALVTALLIVLTVTALVRRDHGRVHLLAGVRGAMEEAEQEAHGNADIDSTEKGRI